jgi:UDP-glucose 4-epimerase
VYGDVQPLPVTERGALDPGTPYAIDKRMGEVALEYYGRAHGLEWAALRFFNVYGPRQRADSPYSGVVSLFLRHVLAGESLTVFGDGSQTRDFVFVQDVARVLAELLLRSEAPTNAAINVASGSSVSVLQLADGVQAAIGTSVERRFVPARSGEVRHSRADVDLLRDVLGWVPSTTLARGLASCLDHDPVPAMAVAGTHVPGDPPTRP